MAERSAPHPQQGDNAPVLLVLVVASPTMLDDIVTVLLDFGVGGTVVESKGLAALLRAEMPIFSGLASLLPETTGSRLVFSVTTRGQADKVMDFLIEGLKHAQRPVGFCVGLDRVVGLRI
jgi:hypothetical protein